METPWELLRRSRQRREDRARREELENAARNASTGEAERPGAVLRELMRRHDRAGGRRREQGDRTNARGNDI